MKVGTAGTDIGAWSKFQVTDVAFATNGNIELIPGKSWGTNGLGLNTGVAAAKATDAGKSTGLGFAYMRSTTASPPVCIPHFMMFQSGVIPAGTANAGAVQKWKYGVKEFASTFDALTAPTAAAAP